MKGMILAALGAMTALSTGNAFGACVSGYRAYSYGYSVGQQLCYDAQLQYANQAVPYAVGAPQQLCNDISTVTQCKAGFRDGFNSGSARYSYGIYIPSCPNLRDYNYGNSYASSYAQTMLSTCNAQQ